MQNAKPKYNIKAVSTLLGIPAGTLRAWERRYQIIRPARNEAGHRLYTDEHLQTLKWLVDKVNEGFTISQAVSLLEDSEDVSSSPQSKEKRNHLNSTQEKFLQCLLAFDERTAQGKLDEALRLFTLETVLKDIIGPLLIQVETMRENKEITSMHEHFAVNFLRSRIGMLLLSMPVEGFKSKALLLPGPDEKHTLGLLFFAFALKSRGYEIVYVGQTTTWRDIERVIDEINPAFVFLSCTSKINTPKSIRLVESLKEKHPELKIGIGGDIYRAFREEERKCLQPYLVGNSKKEWEQWLKESL
ncbi:MerR family transcriptional regulator [Halobacillus andaensis]|uniref:MerR family transcriptional regulator n=1 Tax=Halobacillus andaensis TaxID=1176239 RepID=UPI003D762AF8